MDLSDSPKNIALGFFLFSLSKTNEAETSVGKLGYITFLLIHSE